METRRGFLKLLGSFMVTAATEEVFGKPKQVAPKTIPEYDLLWQSYFPTLTQNEGEHFNFYRCSSNKVTIGYGCNVEDNPDLLKNAVIICKGKPLSKKEKALFLNQYKSKTDKELADYSVTKTDAVAMAKDFTYEAIRNLSDIFSRAHQNTFFNLPIPMQVLALDVYFNLGRKRFLKYKKLKTALLDNDYVKATKEAVVYTGKKKTNKDRERRKKRLLSITNIIQQNPKKALQKLQELVAQNYETETPKLIRVLAGTKDRICENAIVCGEFERVQKKSPYSAKQTFVSNRV